MTVDAQMVRRLRELTGAGMMDCKRALEEAEGDFDRAQQVLRTKGLADAKKRAGREAREGIVEAYVHMNGRLGSLVELNCETDFVANTEEFRTLARDLAMQVAAAEPRWLDVGDVPEDVVAVERKIYEEQARGDGKPENIIGKIVDGKLDAFYGQQCLLRQPFIRDDAVSVGDLVAEAAAKLGEHVRVRRFARFKLGDEDTS